MVELSQGAHAAGPLAIFTSPREAFMGVRARPRPWIYGVLFVALAVLPAVGFVANVDTTALFEKQMRVSGQWEQLADEQREQALKFGPMTYQYGAPIGALAKRLAWILLAALLGWALLKTGEEDLSFGMFVAAVSLACAPLLIADLLTCAVYFVRDTRTLDVVNPLHSNPAAWFSLDSQSLWGAALKRLDVFELWNLWLTAVGLSVVSKKQSGFAWMVPFGIYGVLWIVDIIGGIVGQASQAA